MHNGSRPTSLPTGRYKRPFDLALLIALGVALAPLWLLLWTAIAAAVRIEGPGPMLFVQRRVGRHGRPFDLFKFRTMTEDAERWTGAVWAASPDPRSTRLGTLLRRLHLDELPQVINVLKGDMSLVGPRPERPELSLEIEKRVPGFAHRLAVRPGIAGLAQAKGDYHTNPRCKLRYDRLYIAKMSPLLDLKLLVACVWKVIKQLIAAHPSATPSRFPTASMPSPPAACRNTLWRETNVGGRDLCRASLARAKTTDGAADCRAQHQREGGDGGDLDAEIYEGRAADQCGRARAGLKQLGELDATR